MKRFLVTTFLSIGLLFFFACGSTQSTGKTKESKQNPSTEKSVTPVTPSVQLEWPQFIEHEKGTLKFCQPQIEKWDKDVLEYRMAIEIILKDKEEPIYGGLWLRGITDTSLDERLVQIKSIKVSKIEIPSADSEEVKKVERFINDTLFNKTLVVSLDRVLADAASKSGTVSEKFRYR